MKAYPVLIMLGPAPEAHGGVATLAAAYRAHGLFQRWPVEYLATHGTAGMAFKAAARLAVLLAQHRRAVLHAHVGAGPGFWRDAALLAPALAAGCPLLLHLHGSGFERFYDAAGPGQALVRSLLERAACVAVASQRMVQWVHSVSPAVRATFLPSPVSVPPPPASGPRPKLVLFLGRLHADKGIYDLTDAVAEVHREVPDVRLVCAGAGERAAVARYAERLGIAAVIKFTGWVGPSGKRALFESAAAFALPSYAEDMPTSLLEAMAAGVPVVASPVGGIPEVVADGASGFLAAPGDVATLSRLLRRLLLDRALAERVGAAGRETVRARFAAERALPALEALYDSLGVAPSGARGSPWPASLAG